MPATFTSVTEPWEVLEDEWRRLRQPESPVHIDPALQVCPVKWLLPELQQLMAEHHDEPAEQIRPQIRQLLAERAFAEHETRFGQPHEALLDQSTELYVRVLERLRRQALHDGQLAAYPTPTPWFG
jgi:hypothetical protein